MATAELEIAGLDLGAAGDDDRSLDGIFELAHVPRPRIRLQHRQSLGGRAAHRLAARARELGDEVVDEARNVLAPIAQGRQMDREDVQPVIEIFAELPLGDHRLEVAVGRRHDAHVDLEGLVAADALELALLQGAEELDLDFHRQIADLVEKEGPAIGQLEAAGPAGDRAGERALFVPEELALEDAGRERRAVHAHERPRSHAG